MCACVRARMRVCVCARVRACVHALVGPSPAQRWRPIVGWPRPAAGAVAGHVAPALGVADRPPPLALLVVQVVLCSASKEAGGTAAERIMDALLQCRIRRAGGLVQVGPGRRAGQAAGRHSGCNHVCAAVRWVGHGACLSHAAGSERTRTDAQSGCVHTLWRPKRRRARVHNPNTNPKPENPIDACSGSGRCAAVTRRDSAPVPPAQHAQQARPGAAATTAAAAGRPSSNRDTRRWRPGRCPPVCATCGEARGWAGGGR